MNAGVDEAFIVHPLPAAGLVNQRHSPLFQYAGADPAQHMIAATMLDDDRVNPSAMEQLAQQ